MTELLACPFCGGEPEEYVDAAMIHCRGCGAEMHAASPVACRGGWNRRTPPAQQPEQETETPGWIVENTNDPEVIEECPPCPSTLSGVHGRWEDNGVGYVQCASCGLAGHVVVIRRAPSGEKK